MKGKRERLLKKQAKKPPKNKGGRPSAWLKVEPRVGEVMDLYANGATMDQIAAHIGISPAALYKLKAQKGEFREAFRIGRLMQEGHLEGKLWELATGKAERRITEERVIAPGEEPKKLYNELHRGGPRAGEPTEEEIEEIAAKVKAIEEAGLTPVVKRERVIYLEPQLSAILAILRQRHGWQDTRQRPIIAAEPVNTLEDQAAKEAVCRSLGLAPCNAEEIEERRRRASRMLRVSDTEDTEVEAIEI